MENRHLHENNTGIFPLALPILKKQLSHVWQIIALALLGGILFISLLIVLKYTTGVSFMSLTRDVNALYDAPFYTGISSMLGIIMWSFAASACLLTSWTAYSTGKDHKFMLYSGLFTLLLLLDDAFQLHEDFFPHYLNIPEKVVYGAYFIAFVSYIVGNYKEILRHEFLIWAGSLFFLFCSTMVDLIDDYFQARFLLEEGLKILGIILWTVFFIRTSKRIIVQPLIQKPLGNYPRQRESTKQREPSKRRVSS